MGIASRHDSAVNLFRVAAPAFPTAPASLSLGLLWLLAVPGIFFPKRWMCSDGSVTHRLQKAPLLHRYTGSCFRIIPFSLLLPLAAHHPFSPSIPLSFLPVASPGPIELVMGMHTGTDGLPDPLFHASAGQLGCWEEPTRRYFYGAFRVVLPALVSFPAVAFNACQRTRHRRAFPFSIYEPFSSASG